MNSNTNLPIYAYRFDWGSPDKDSVSVLPKGMGRDLGAHHAAEIPFFLGMSKSSISILTGKTHTKNNRLGREKLKDLCMNYLANFARTGNPNGEGLLYWYPWDDIKEKDKILVLDASNDDLRISYLKDILTEKRVIELINLELEEPELGTILSYLDEMIPFGFNEPEQ
jgi:para-nitrobenzyl esterase